MLVWDCIIIGSALAGDNGEVGLTREAKRKRKKKSQQAKVQETGDDKVTLSDTEEQMKQLKVSEIDSLKTDSKSSKRKKKTRGHADKGSPKKDSMRESVDGECVDEMEVSTPLKKKKHQKKEKHFGDHQEINAEPTASDDHPEQATLLCDAEIVDVDEFVRNDQGSDAIISQSEGEGGSQEDMDAEDGKDGEVVVPLMPLGHGETMARERKAVQRQLPQWITEAEIIPDDITEQSR